MRCLFEGIPAREPCDVDGLSMEGWLGLWSECFANVQGSLVRMAWPDGRSLVEQPSLGVEMFDLITGEAMKKQEAERKSAE